ncbi:MAG: hypothetical protein PHG36_02045, partial [Dehalococcoidia bacterium]|nr:hypothetical protein [Dehalococcoidia bacterium]
MEKLRELNAIRNYFAHCGPEVFPGHPPINPEEGRIPHPANYNKTIDFDDLYNKFVSIEPEISAYLGEIFTNLRGIMTKE